jgi:hypothetical protein
VLMLIVHEGAHAQQPCAVVCACESTSLMRTPAACTGHEQGDRSSMHKLHARNEHPKCSSCTSCAWACVVDMAARCGGDGAHAAGWSDEVDEGEGEVEKYEVAAKGVAEMTHLLILQRCVDSESAGYLGFRHSQQVHYGSTVRTSPLTSHPLPSSPLLPPLSTLTQWHHSVDKVNGS